MLQIQLHPVDIQDPYGAVGPIAALRSLYPLLRHLFAADGYAGDDVVNRVPATKGFEVLPWRWVVERAFAWLGRCRTLAKDVEATVTCAVAWMLIAHIRLLTQRLARP